MWPVRLLAWPFEWEPGQGVYRAAIALLLAVPVMALLLHWHHHRPYNVALDVQSEQAGVVQVFYDRGGPETGQDASILRVLSPGSTARTYRFPLRSGSYRWLRIDPGNRPGRYTIANLRIEGPDGSRRDLAVEGLQPLWQVESLTMSGGSAIVAASGIDPALQVRFEPNLVLPPPRADLPTLLVLLAAAVSVGGVASRFLLPAAGAGEWRVGVGLVLFQLLVNIAAAGLPQGIVVPPDGRAFLSYFDAHARYESIYNWPGSRSLLLPWIIHYVLQQNLSFILLLNFLLASLLPVLVYRLLRTVSFGTRAALVGALTFSILPFHVAYSRLLLTETLATVLLCLALYLVLDHQRQGTSARAARAGVAAGLLVMTRMQFALLLPLFMLWMWLRPPSGPGAERSRWAAPAAFAASAAAFVLALPAMHYAYSGHAVITAHFGLVNHGQGLLEHLEVANPVDQTLIRIYRDWRTAHPDDIPSTTTPNVLHIANDATGLPYPELVSRYRRLTAVALWEHPGVYLRAVARNAYGYLFVQPGLMDQAFAGRWPGWTARLVKYDAVAKKVLVTATLGAIVLVAGMVLASRLRGRRQGDRRMLPPHVFASGLLSMMVLMDVAVASALENSEGTRYWIPMSPVMFVLAATGWASLPWAFGSRAMSPASSGLGHTRPGETPPAEAVQ
ncbi:MAG: glycosyltransferase family 39 protein [Vicinamibacterales bacterium]